jgi:N-acetylmuramoyl-L-alanine amidase CwlA
MKIIQSILTKNPCYTLGQKIAVKGLMLHSVGCPQPIAMAFVNSWNKPEHDTSCVHAFIDGNTGDVYQTLPWNHRGWHGGGSSNDTHIGVEMCEPACIKYTGGATFTCSDIATAKAVVQRTYDTAVQLFAHLCKQYKLNPLGDGVIISHKEGHKRGVASNHGDPEHLWNQLGMGYTMDTFRKAVKAAMTTPTESVGVLYRVQLGAFGNKANAEVQLATVKKAGFDAFIAFVDNLYKIQVGAFSKKSNADAMLEKVKKAGFNGFITTKSGQAVAVTKPTKKSITEIAKEVIAGKWGNGADRKKRLTAAGYDYSAVQKEVNKLL